MAAEGSKSGCWKKLLVKYFLLSISNVSWLTGGPEATEQTDEVARWSYSFQWTDRQRNRKTTTVNVESVNKKPLRSVAAHESGVGVVAAEKETFCSISSLVIPLYLPSSIKMGFIKRRETSSLRSGPPMAAILCWNWLWETKMIRWSGMLHQPSAQGRKRP